MAAKLSWDLFVVVFFVTIVAYSFIIGRNGTLKVIIGTYIAALTADALGNIFDRYFSASKSVAKVINNAIISNSAEAVIALKVFLFILLVIIFATRGNFTVETESDRGGAIKVTILLILGFLTAAFIMSTLIAYASGISFIQSTPLAGSGALHLDVKSVFAESRLLSVLGNYYNFWFSLPALFLVFANYILMDRD